MKILIYSLLAITLLFPVTSQAGPSDTPDSLKIEEPKNNGLLAANLGILTVGVWAPSRILGTDWAYIGFNTIEQNMRTGFVWDHDDWSMNQWGHPIHGGQFFNAARTNGYDFWGSMPFTMAGSLAWEMFFEAEPPATNDLVTTVLGGAYMGETAYRISSMILDNSSTGSERTFRELGAFFCQPRAGL